MSRMPASRKLDAIWEAAIQLLGISNRQGLEVLGLRVDVFRVEETQGPKQQEQVRLVRTYSWGEEVQFHGEELTRDLFSVANMYGFERSGTNGRFGNVVNDSYAAPGACYVIGWDKNHFRTVTVSFSSPLPTNFKPGHGWSCTEGAEHLAFLICALFNDILLIGRSSSAAA